MGRKLESLRWTFKNDFKEPFYEIVLFVLVFIAATKNFLDASALGQTFAGLTSSEIYVIIFLVAIGGARSFGLAIERGEISRQMIGQRIGRTKFLLNKFLSFYLLTFIALLIVDFVALFEYMGYFFSFSAYLPLIAAPFPTWLFVVAEQLLLLLFLDSLMLFLSLTLSSTTVALFIFLAYTILGVSLYVVSLPAWANYIQLGYGDYNIVNEFSELVYAFFFGNVYATGTLQIFASSLSISFYVGLAYRAVAGFGLFLSSLIWFRRMDLD